MRGPIYPTGEKKNQRSVRGTPHCDPSTEETREGGQSQLPSKFQVSLEDTVRLKMNRRKEEIKGEGSRDFRGGWDRYLTGTNLNCPHKAEM